MFPDTVVVVSIKGGDWKVIAEIIKLLILNVIFKIFVLMLIISNLLTYTYIYFGYITMTIWYGSTPNSCTVAFQADIVIHVVAFST